MKIGELARETGTPVETIRYYEREGLLPAAPRSAGNYRVWGEAHVERLAFVRHCRALDMSTDEIRVLLRFKDAPDQPCDEVNALLDAHIGHVSERIRALRQLERQLQRLRAQCVQARDAAQCGILDGLSAQAAEPAAAAGVHVGGSHGRAARRRSSAG